MQISGIVECDGGVSGIRSAIPAQRGIEQRTQPEAVLVADHQRQAQISVLGKPFSPVVPTQIEEHLIVHAAIEIIIGQRCDGVLGDLYHDLSRPAVVE